MVTLSCRLSHLTALSSHLSICRSCGGERLSCLHSALCTPWSLITRGTCQMLDTSLRFITWVGLTWQKSASFSFTLCSRGSLLLQAKKVGVIPTDLSTWTLCCVGLVFCSPTTPRTGTRLTCTVHTSWASCLNWNCLKASRKGPDSMSPTVPPSSMMHTSGVWPDPSTGMWATLSIQFWMASVRCGTTCTVLPRNAPSLSFSITDWKIFPVVMLWSLVSVIPMNRS
mmetsp:Transcript_6492/g.19583  ORF Transcript_6492/g.19583 Transcript_6492/m.19583 type:complete len:226 (-) Transcript_6492:324-1001(-)